MQLNNINNKIRRNSIKNTYITSNILKNSNGPINRNRKKNNTSRSKKKSLRNNQNDSSKDELYFLSNANLNIINILNTCISEDIYDQPSFINIHKDKSKDIISQRPKTTLKPERKKDILNRKGKYKTNILSIKNKESTINKKNNNFTSTENDSLNYSKKSNCKKYLLSGKEIKSDQKIFNDKNKRKGEKYYTILGSECLSSISYNKTILNNKPRSKSNKRLYNLKMNNFISLDSNNNLYNNNVDKNNILDELSQNEIYKLNKNINNEVNSINLK